MPVPSNGSHWRVNTCFGKNGGGSWHSVSIRTKFQDERQTDASAVNEPVPDADSIQVNLDLTGDGDCVIAEFSQNGRPIRRCGSGTVAAAQILLEQCHYPSGTALQTSVERLALQQRGDLFGYTGESLPVQAAAPPPTRCFDIHPRACHTVGGDQDYLILTFEQSDQIRALTPNLTAICQSTQRAIIATAPADQTGFDFVLRYFAPQYSPREDNATGSANILLGHFWSVLLNKRRLRSQQLSVAGGEFYLEVGKAENLTLENPASVTLLARSRLALQTRG